jgi:superfamily II DNA or RNA helicase
MMAYMTRGAQDKGKTSMLVAHRAEILDQIRGALASQGASANVMSIQTLAKRLDTVLEPDFLIIDEAHHCPSGQYKKVLERWTKCKVLGVTATPERLDGKGLGDCFESMVLGPEVEWLMANNYLKRARYYGPPKAPDLSKVPKRGGDYVREELEEVVMDKALTGSLVKEYAKHGQGQQAIVFCVSINHAKQVRDEFADCGYDSEEVDGKTANRGEIMEKFKHGYIQVLTSCELISEGFDCPAVGCAIMARPTESFGMYRQQGGRALRGQGWATILDHAGNVSKHGYLNYPVEWTLEGEASKRRGEETPMTAIRQCAACYAIYTGLKCSECGAEQTPTPREIKQREGDLAELQESKLRRSQKTEEGKCRSFADFKALAIKRGYNPQWAFFRAKARGYV